MSFAVDALSAGYGRRPILSELSLAPVAGGAVVALLGPNGAGKSTLLRAIAGLVPATGRVLFDGIDLAALTSRERARRLAFVPQSLPVATTLTVLDAAVAALRVARPEVTAREAAARGRAALDRLGAAALALEPIARLSGGQRQIAGLAPALAADPGLLLLDEPSSALDIAHQFRLMRLLRALADEGRVVVVVLHDIALAARWADTLAILARGRLVAQGAPSVVLTPAILAEVWGVRARVSGAPPRIAIEDLVPEP